MDTNISFGVALIFLSFAIAYVTIKNRVLDQVQNNTKKDVELLIYKKEMDRLEECLRRKEISWDNFLIFRKNLEEKHFKNMLEISKSKN